MNNTVFCSSCNQPGHQRRTHRDCPNNPRNRINTPTTPTTSNAAQVINEDQSICIHCQQVGHLNNMNPLCANYSPAVPRCICGEDTHQRTNYTYCPLNPNGRINPYLIATQTIISPELHYLGSMSYRCSMCHALMWLLEKSGGTAQDPLFQMCCSKGETIAHPLTETPAYIKSLLQSNNQESRDFKTNIRAYNSALSFTSLGVELDQAVNNSRHGAYCFRIHGSLYHRIGSLLPEEGEQPKFAQIYIYDSDLDTQLNRRASIMPHINRNTMSMLQELMHTLPNPYVESYKYMMRRLYENPTIAPHIRFVLQPHGTPDNRRYNAPVHSEVAVLMLGSGNPENEYTTSKRDIVIYPQNGNHLERLDESNQSYDPLSYALMFPHGDYGWTWESTSLSNNRKLSAMDFYSFRLMYRNDDHSLHLYGKLFHQYIVDMYAKIEHDRLQYFKDHQIEIRADLYTGLRDALNNNDRDLQEVGRRVILPSTFIGGPRHMTQLYQDAISIVRRFGKPDYFITFTCNPYWREIQDELLFGQSAADRPDLCARVFHLKLKELLHDITKEGILGRVAAFIKVIEFQKRGLPHAHMLFIMTPEDKPMTTMDIDNVISAEIPDPIMHPQAYETVTRHMMHGPCGGLNPHAACMNDNICSKKYPRPYAELTTTSNTGYPVYRRRNDGRVFERSTTVQLDNRWVVPHNIYLCTKYNAHINVEVCTNFRVVKYLYKYVYKGHDRARAVLRQNGSNSNPSNTTVPQTAESLDEIRKFLDARYVAAPEAIYRILSFSLHQESPPHQRLDIHLPNDQMVYFRADSDAARVLNRAEREKTTLTEWMVRNGRDRLARNYLYHEFPEHYVWQKGTKEWTPRLRHDKGTIGRVFSVSPRETERYYLRIMLLHIRGATSFEELRTVNSEIYPTFKQAAEALGLVEDDSMWMTCMVEGSSYQMPRSLRSLFVTLLVFCNPSNPFEIWNRFKNDLAEDYLNRMRLMNGNQELTEDMLDEAHNNCLLDINDLLYVHNFTLTNYAGFTMPTHDTRNMNMNMNMPTNEPRTIAEERELCRQARLGPDPSLLPFNDDQRLIFDAVLRTTENNYLRTTAPFNNIFFIDGPGGTGKTFTFNAILDAIRRTGEIAIAVASSGAAAVLLKGGRTAHSRFAIPLRLTATSTCTFTAQGDIARLLRLAKIFIWDEASMISRNTVLAVDRSLRDIMHSVDPLLGSVPFGGKIFVFGGDFRQVLPVIPRGSRADVVEQCLNQTPLWRYVQRLPLRVNMRVLQALQSSDPTMANHLADFSQYLLNVGNGAIPTVEDYEYIRVRDDMVIPDGDYSSLAASVYNNFQDPADRTSESLGQKAILAPTNAKVNDINDFLLGIFSDEPAIEYFSFDRVSDEERSMLFPAEFLNTLNPSGLPPSRLCLKVGAIIVLLRNISPTEGLCNGTRLICRELHPNLIVVEIAAGTRAGNIAFIPRIDLKSDEEQINVEFKRKQFPVRLAFAMTINKAQGQTLNKVGLYLKDPVFSHGQLYVAMSRVRRPEDISMVLSTANSLLFGWEGHYTANIVYPEVLN